MNQSTINNLDTSNCDKEPVSFIASIQSHAALFSFSKGDFRIHNSSENISKLFGTSEVLHKRVNEFPIGKIIIAHLDDKMKSEEWSEYKELYFKLDYQGQVFETHAFEIEGLIACEIESSHWFEDGYLENKIKTFRQSHSISKFKQNTNVALLGKELCHEIRTLTGLERVMLYKFSPEDWHGLVIAEDKTASAHSFLGHRFPATDIPKPARDLYLQNKVRYIADSSATSSPVIPAVNAANGKTIDLSTSKTRAVSPIHLEYLKNMGVKTSYSVAIVVNGDLWGLIACHSQSLLFINQDMRLISENLAESFAIAVPLIELNTIQKKQIDFTAGLFEIISQINQVENPLEQLFKSHTVLLKVFNCDGMAMIENNNITLAGFTPLKNDLLEISRTLQEKLEHSHKDILAIDSLASLNEKWSLISELASGVLIIKLNHFNQSTLMLFRKEIRSTIVWGGDPRKLENRNYKGQLNPRKSFESWEEVVTHKSLPWTSEELDGAMKFKNIVFDTIIANNNKNNELQQKLLNNKKTT